jgi:glycosyltransferase involved in cell wall biosynthesis
MSRRYQERGVSRARVCFVLPSLSGGGAERAAVTVINALDRRRFEPELCLFRREGAYLDHVAADVCIRDLESSGSRFGRVGALRRLFAATQPRLVMSFLSYVSVFAAARAARRGIRFVINQQTPLTAFLQDQDYRWREPLRRALFERGVREVYPRADSIVATSCGVREDLVTAFGVKAERVRVLHNPVDIERIAALARDPIAPELVQPGDRIVVSAGRLAQVKNFPLLIDAVALLSARLPVHLWILGQGDEEPALRRLAAERGVESRVSLLGFHTNPWRFFARADVFALTSRYEGFGNVLVEAMASGVPVVATESSGTREIIEDGVNGLLVGSHDSAAVAAALERVLTDADGARSLAARATAGIAEYGIGEVAGRYEALFDSLLTAA